MISRYINTLYRKWITPVLITLIPIASTAETQISVYHLQGLHTEQHNGAYDKIILTIKQRGVDLSLRFAPIVRAKHLFQNNQINCLCPADAADWFYPFPTVQTLPLNYAKAFIFTREEDPVISTPEQLKGLKIGVRTGMNFGDRFDGYKHTIKLDIEEVRDIELNYKKLLAGRIDAFMAYTPDIWNLLGQKDLSKLSYDKNNPFYVHPESIVCHDTPENRVFIKQFNHELSQLKQQGTLKELLGISYTLD